MTPRLNSISLQTIFLIVYFISVSNHTVKKMGGDSYFLFKLALLRTSAAPRRLRHVATTWRLHWGTWGFSPRVWPFSLLSWIIWLFKFILNLLCVVIVHLIIIHTITSLLLRFYLHKIRIENIVVLTFEKLMLPCRHTKNSHSTWSIRHVWLFD